MFRNKVCKMLIFLLFFLLGFSSLQQRLDNSSTADSKSSAPSNNDGPAPAEVKPLQQNGLSLQLPYRPSGKVVLFGKPRTDSQQGSSLPSGSQQSQTPNKVFLPYIFALNITYILYKLFELFLL